MHIGRRRMDAKKKGTILSILYKIESPIVIPYAALSSMFCESRMKLPGARMLSNENAETKNKIMKKCFTDNLS
jgi:hypothetical protein